MISETFPIKGYANYKEQEKLICASWHQSWISQNKIILSYNLLT